MNLSELGEIKNTAIAKVIKDANVLDVLLGSYNEDEDLDALLFGNEHDSDGCVFNFEYVPDVQESSKTFLCFEVIPHKTDGDAVMQAYLYVFAYCSKYIMRNYHRDGASGTRVDILMSDVDKILSGNPDFGIGRLRYLEGDIYKPANTYYGRMSVYEVYSHKRDRSLNG